MLGANAANLCTNKPNGMYAESNPSAYYVCTNGNMSRSCCPEGTYYCPEAKSCGPEDTRACTYPTRPSSATHCRNNCYSSHTCPQNAWEHHTTGVVKRNTNVWDTVTACDCVPGPVQYACAAGYYGTASASSSDCTLCPPLIDPYGDAIARTSPIGSTDMSQCTTPASYQPVCPKTDTGKYVPNKKDARAFHMCVYDQGYEETTGPNGTGTVLTTGYPAISMCCGNGLVFDINAGACNWPDSNINPYPTPSGECKRSNPCPANTYGPAVGYCENCPDGGKTSTYNYVVTSCFLPADENQTNTKGTFSFTENCYYSK